MSLKSIINRSKILAGAVIDPELVIPGEPMIYSIKYSLGNRTLSTQFLRNRQWKSLLKSYFRSQYNTNTPVVLTVTFYVTPHEDVVISQQTLKRERTPATRSHELCDYLLSLMEMLLKVLVNSYRQIVKIDAKKFYSANPRTIMRFTTWSDYAKLKDTHSNDTEAKGLSQNLGQPSLQPKCKRNGSNARVRPELTGTALSGLGADEGASASDSPLQDTRTTKSTWPKTRTAKLPTAYKEA